MQLAVALRARGASVAILDADLNGPSQARMAGLADAPLLPGAHGALMPRTGGRHRRGVDGLTVPESQPLEFDSVARGESYIWRATREFALLGDLLAGVAWGELDCLLVDLPPGVERTVQYAEFLGADTALVLVTIPSELSRGVVARSVAALRGAPNRLLGYVENMQRLPVPGLRLHQTALPMHQRDRCRRSLPGNRPVRSRARRRLRSGRDGARRRGRRLPGARSTGSPTRSGVALEVPMKFLCVLCDQPMKLVEVAPPDRGALSVALRMSGVRQSDRHADQPDGDPAGAVAGRPDRPRRARPASRNARSRE